MSWMASGWVKKSTLGSGTRKAVMLVVADYCTEDAAALRIDVPDGWAVCWAGLDVIAKDAEVNERTVRRVLDDMEAAGVVRRERRHDEHGWRAHDLIWLEYGRRFADLTDRHPTGKPDRTESPLGAGNDAAEPVDNHTAEAGQVDSENAPTGLSRQRQVDSDDTPLKRKNRQVEPPGNQQHHPGNVRRDRARAREQNGSSTVEAAAPAARARPPPTSVAAA